MRRLLTLALLAPLAVTFGDDSMTGRWRMIETNGNPTARHEDSIVAFEGKLYLLGGRGIKPVEEYNPATSTWRQLSPTPLEIHHFQPVVLGDTVYVMSAMTGRYPRETPIENIYLYKPKTDTWIKGPAVPQHRRRGCAGTVVYQGKIYLAGGITLGHTSGTNGWFDEFDPETGRWRELPDAPHIRDHFPAIQVGGKLYLVGGRNTSFHTEAQFIAFFGAVIKE
ncbi:MAG: galactose oxidase, partial [bacterium]|nr:galactose oxidase [bacterium]